MTAQELAKQCYRAETIVSKEHDVLRETEKLLKEGSPDRLAVKERLERFGKVRGVLASAMYYFDQVVELEKKMGEIKPDLDVDEVVK